MLKITFVSHQGEETSVEVTAGTTVMKAAVDNGIAGIDGDCGGECSCATCHVLIDDNWFAKAGCTTEREESMLDLNPDRGSSSRLGCQIQITSELDGIVVKLPEFQY